MTYSEAYLNNVLNFSHVFQSQPLSQEVFICSKILVKWVFLITVLSQPSLSNQKPLTWSFSSSSSVTEHTVCFCYLHWELGEHNWRWRHKEKEGGKWTFFITLTYFNYYLCYYPDCLTLMPFALAVTRFYRYRKPWSSYSEYYYIFVMIIELLLKESVTVQQTLQIKLNIDGFTSA